MFRPLQEIMNTGIHSPVLKEELDIAVTNVPHI
jgi:hypothetical protein